MAQFEIARVRLEAADSRGRGESLLTTYMHEPTRDRTMPGGATERNMFKYLGNMAKEGWHIAAVERIPTGGAATDSVFWLQREVS